MEMYLLCIWSSFLMDFVSLLTEVYFCYYNMCYFSCPKKNVDDHDDISSTTSGSSSLASEKGTEGTDQSLELAHI